MLFKLSLRNIKRSFKDYGIFFLTLVFAVSMFYIFNSIDSQTAMLELNESKYRIIGGLIFIVDKLSLFVSFILGFLIVYINRFLIKRRKKEIGIYGALGMSKYKISTVMVIETILIGLISLVVGLLVGVFLSQFLSIIIGNLFKVSLKEYAFIFSKIAFNKTILYFTIIFILVLIFNIISVNRNKLIDLLHAKRVNEKIKLRNKYFLIIGFILTVILLGRAYYLLLHEDALLDFGKITVYMLIEGSLGTCLLFFTLSGFLLNLFKLFKKVYYKKLNMFIFKQVDTRINSMVISTTVISLMLLLTIGLLSCSLSLSNVYNKDFEKSNRTDFTIYSFSDEMNPDKVNNYYQKFINSDSYKENVDRSMNLNLYQDEVLLEDILSERANKYLVKKFGKPADVVFGTYLYLMKESDYIKYMNFINEKPISIGDDEYLISADIKIVMDILNISLEDGKNIEFKDKTFKPALNRVHSFPITNSLSGSNDGIIILKDKYFDEDVKASNYYIYGYLKDGKNIDRVMASEDGVFHNLITKQEMADNGAGTTIMLVFISLYLGITFAISSASILAISQLCDASDNKERYKILRNLGADEKMINKAFFIQVLLIFLFPLIVALFHAFFGVREFNNLIIMFGDIDLTTNILLTSLFLVIIYGGYFYLTYVSGKKIIKER